jgi:hypothetical protein
MFMLPAMVIIPGQALIMAASLGPADRLRG